MNEYLNVFRKYTVFTGRARRREYWMFILFNAIVTILLSVVDAMLGWYDQGIQLGILSGIYSFAALLPALAVGARRLHDTRRSGWWLLIGLIPVVGTLVLLVFSAQEGEAGSNKWGPNPKDEVTPYPGSV